MLKQTEEGETCTIFYAFGVEDEDRQCTYKVHRYCGGKKFFMFEYMR